MITCPGYSWSLYVSVVLNVRWVVEKVVRNIRSSSIFDTFELPEFQNFPFYFCCDTTSLLIGDFVPNPTWKLRDRTTLLMKQILLIFSATPYSCHQFPVSCWNCYPYRSSYRSIPSWGEAEQVARNRYSDIGRCYSSCDGTWREGTLQTRNCCLDAHSKYCHNHLGLTRTCKYLLLLFSSRTIHHV